MIDAREGGWALTLGGFESGAGDHVVGILGRDAALFNGGGSIVCA
jgi:hypothetical protein